MTPKPSRKQLLRAIDSLTEQRNDAAESLTSRAEANRTLSKDLHDALDQIKVLKAMERENTGLHQELAVAHGVILALENRAQELGDMVRHTLGFPDRHADITGGPGSAIHSRNIDSAMYQHNGQ